MDDDMFFIIRILTGIGQYPSFIQFFNSTKLYLNHILFKMATIEWVIANYLFLIVFVLLFEDY